MTEVKFTLPGQEIVTLAGQTIDKLVRTGDGDAALLYLYVLKTKGQSTSSEAAAALGKSEGGIATAMAILSRLGLIRLDGEIRTQGRGVGAPPDGMENGMEKTPSSDMDEYPCHRSVGQMQKELESGSVFFALAEETQKSLGKILSPDELMRLFEIYDGLHIPPEVILQLVTHCIAESRRSRSGRMPSMRYIEKAAYTWEREGINSLERAEEYLRALDARRTLSGQIKKAMQIKDREFSETEKRYVESWIAMGFAAGAAEIAYDRTLIKTGKLAWGYMDSIMKNWHERNIHTPAEIQEKDGKFGAKKKYESKPLPREKFGDADKEEIKRMQRLLDKIRES